jgi:hypothetical protein
LSRDRFSGLDLKYRIVSVLLKGATMVVCFKMTRAKHSCVLELTSLHWPVDLRVPLPRFRLFIAADTTGATVESLSEFAESALKQGMVYFCAWGPDCERFHDFVDEVILEDDLGKRLFTGPNRQDTVMTTWHATHTLDEALDFFVNFACPTDGFAPDSDYWLAICINDSVWATVIRQQLESLNLPESE